MLVAVATAVSRAAGRVLVNLAWSSRKLTWPRNALPHWSSYAPGFLKEHSLRAYVDVL